MNIKTFIIEKMREEGLTQTAIAKKIGISQPCINKILKENGTASLETLSKIAVAYRLPVSYFLSEGITKPCNCPENSEWCYKIQALLEKLEAHELEHVYTYILTYLQIRRNRNGDVSPQNC